MKIIWSETFLVPKLYINGLVLALTISIIFIGVYVYILANTSRKISNALNQVQIALINQKKVSEIGSLAAAAAHELSTPLNTIFLIIGDLLKDSKINKNLKSEVLLLKKQAIRCKKILLNLSKNPQNIKDSFFKKTTMSNLVNINFEKFLINKKNLETNIQILEEKKEPLIIFSDEIMYGLGNIIQNAIEHARKKIDVNVSWDNRNIFVYVKDDGRGFTNEILERIGSPYISNNNNENSMGLGIFIAKNLIEKIQGNIEFSNQPHNLGSEVKISLKRNI
tara:strand:- start:189 stop:1025 length:837 start_codon:yes stop_codon:yes gene_type:complete